MDLRPQCMDEIMGYLKRIELKMDAVAGAVNEAAGTIESGAIIVWDLIEHTFDPYNNL